MAQIGGLGFVDNLPHQFLRTIYHPELFWLVSLEKGKYCVIVGLHRLYHVSKDLDGVDDGIGHAESHGFAAQEMIPGVQCMAQPWRKVPNLSHLFLYNVAEVAVKSMAISKVAEKLMLGLVYDKDDMWNPCCRHVFQDVLGHRLVMVIPDYGIQFLGIFLFLFLAVWLPCCSSDIVYPLLFPKKRMNN